MRLATGATHARDTREKAPVFIRAVLRKKPLRSPPLSFGTADFRDFIYYQKPALDRGFISAEETRKRTPRPLRQFHDRSIRCAHSAPFFHGRSRGFKPIYLAIRPSV